jgi:endonuclease YncB( thermonuclease family)
MLRSAKIQRWTAILVLVVLAVLLGKFDHWSGLPLGSPGATITGRVKLVDGDSFFLLGQEVRLKGIDAPEGRQTCWKEGKEWACGDASRDELRHLIGGLDVTCTAAEVDRHGRLLAYCRAGEKSLNREMVALGMAVSYGDFVKEELAARIARRGLWNSKFEKPREWRKRNRIGI